MSVKFIDCTSEITDEDTKYAAANGHLAQDVALNGTMHMFAANGASPKASSISILVVIITRLSLFHISARRKHRIRKT
jgi:hypothetical protein